MATNPEPPHIVSFELNCRKCAMPFLEDDAASLVGEIAADGAQRGQTTNEALNAWIDRFHDGGHKMPKRAKVDAVSPWSKSGKSSDLAQLDKEHRKLAERALRAGWTHRKTGAGIMLYSPDGETTVGVHGTPSDQRSIRMMRAALRRGGLEL